MVPLETDPIVELGLSLALGPELDMLKVTGGEPKGGGEPEQSKEESECGLKRTYSMMTGRRKSTDWKLRVKAKKSPGEVPWGHNDDGKKKNRQR